MASRPSTREWKTAWPGLLAGAALVVLAGLLLQLKLGSGLARSSYDLPFLLNNPNGSEGLVMVYVDSSIKSRLGQPTDQPLNRRFHAQLVDRLTRERARLVVFDILFDTPAVDAEADATFAEAIRRNGKVVLAGEYLQQWQGDYLTSTVLPPIALLTNAAAGWGLAN